MRFANPKQGKADPQKVCHSVYQAVVLFDRLAVLDRLEFAFT